MKMSETSAADPNKPAEEKPSLLWTIVLYAGAMGILPCVLFLSLDYLLSLIVALLMLNGLLVTFLYIGLKRQEQVKGKDISATTFSRKMFNIIAGLLFAFFIWIYSFIRLEGSAWMGFFTLLAIDYAFGIHEVIYAGLKKKTYFTDAFVALGRQSEPYKPYLASIMALFAFTIVLGFQSWLFQNLVNYEYTVMIVYIATVLIWGVGDTAAYFAGTKYGKRKLPWNKKKSWAGFFANMAVGIGLGFFFFAPFMLSIVTPAWWIILALVGGASGAFFESVDFRLDDNFVTPAFVGIILGVLIILI